MDFIDYREKLGIGFCDKEKMNYFFTKAFNLFDGMNHDYMHDQIDNSEYFEFRLQFSKIEKQVRVCEFLNRTLFLLHLPLKIVERLDMPQAFAGDGTKGQRTEKVDEEDFRYVKGLSFSERFKLPSVAPIIYGGFGVAGQSDNILHGNDILILAEQFGVIVVHLPKYILGQFL